ncbi:MAG TPA: hypothetical protein VFD78_06850 [Chitinophagaceae bacterium]|nr:hypothetical protein [Chitinophagaceae bacterium]
MRLYLVLLLILAYGLVLIACRDGTTKILTSSEVGVELNESNRKNNWINIEYLFCVKSKSPCECLTRNEISAISFKNSMKNAVIYNNDLENVKYQLGVLENDTMYLINYSKYTGYNGDSSIYFTPKSDTLFIGDEAFVPHDGLIREDESLIQVINTSVFFNIYGSFLDSIDTSGLYLVCHNYEKKNYLFSGDCSRQYLLDYKFDSIVVKKILNGCELTPIENKMELLPYGSIPIVK